MRRNNDALEGDTDPFLLSSVPERAIVALVVFRNCSSGPYDMLSPSGSSWVPPNPMPRDGFGDFDCATAFRVTGGIASCAELDALSPGDRDLGNGRMPLPGLAASDDEEERILVLDGTRARTALVGDSSSLCSSSSASAPIAGLPRDVPPDVIELWFPVSEANVNSDSGSSIGSFLLLSLYG